MATKRGLFNKYPLAVMPFQLVLVGMCVTFATPMCCAFFNQQATISVSKLEPHLQEIVMKKHPDVTEVVFNKGL